MEQEGVGVGDSLLTAWCTVRTIQEREISLAVDEWWLNVSAVYRIGRGGGESTGECEEAGKEIVERISMQFTMITEAGLPSKL